MDNPDAPKPLYFHVVSSPVGDLGLVASARGITHVLFNPERELKHLSRTYQVLSTRPDLADEDDGQTAARHLLLAARQLRDYFAGERRHFSLVLDLAPDAVSAASSSHHSKKRTGSFRTAAHLELLNINYGETASYGDIAEALGSPGAARAVGGACANNPIPIIIPCHRVLPSTGKIGNYSGGTGPETKKFLLNLESAN